MTFISKALFELEIRYVKKAAMTTHQLYMDLSTGNKN